MWLDKVMLMMMMMMTTTTTMMMKLTYSYSYFKARNLVINDVFLNEIGKDFTGFIELA
jgi:hypothetical protein